jgi:hypothetical protein
MVRNLRRYWLPAAASRRWGAFTNICGTKEQAVDPVWVVTETTRTNNLASVSGASACMALQGDMDCNCRIDAADLQALTARWRQAAGLPYDLDGDGKVTVADIMRVAAAWGNTCP